MRPTRFLLASALSAAASTGAACTDSLFLQSITVFRQSLKNTATLGDWDSVKVNPWDANDLLKAAPLGYPYSNDADVATHYLAFKFDCGADTASAVQGARVITKRVRSGEEYRHQTTLESFTTDASVIMIDGDGKGTSLNGVPFSNLWKSNLFYIGKKTASSPRQSYGQVAVADIYSSTSTSTSWKSRSAAGYGVYPVLADHDNVLSEFLEDTVSLYVAKLGSGVDSVRTQIVRFRYEYDYTKPATGIRSSAPRAAFRVNAGANGWSIQLTQAAPVSIYSTEGRLIRQFSAARSVFWDGRDASGAKVRPGLWVVRASGHGAVPVLVR
ncbi:MAG TPA: hypothetical protein PK208_13055 [Fibrobacteria bacterium]|nr:hypothetical protein [Fibrobacteria bacterium]